MRPERTQMLQLKMQVGKEIAHRGVTEPSQNG